MTAPSPLKSLVGTLVKVDGKGPRRKVLVARPAVPSHDNIASIGCNAGDPIALLGGSKGKLVFSVARLTAVV